MSFFEGVQFSTIQDVMPSRKWEKEQYISDWEKKMKEDDSGFSKEKRQTIIEKVILPMYGIYEELLAMANEENISDEEQELIIKDLNLAMLNIQEYGIRTGLNIVQSIKARKYKGVKNNRQEAYNKIIDILVDEFTNVLARVD